MKKTYKYRFIAGVFALVSAMFLFSCASKSEVKDADAVVEEGEAPDVEETVSAAVEESVPEVVEETAEETEEVEEEKWSSGVKKIDLKIGNIRLKIHPNKGTFNIFAKNEKGKYVSLLYTGNEYTNSSFYLKAGKNILKLNENAAVSSAARKTNTGAQIKYSINRTAEIIVDFAFQKSDEKYDFDILKITTTVTNIGSRDWSCASKLVLDTILGETGKAHFYDSMNKPVKSELCLREFSQNKWFVSKNNAASLQMIFEGRGVSKPALVALANYATLENMNWEPDMLTYRTFDTVMAYSNSAVGVLWPERLLKPEESMSDTFFISVAADENVPAGADLICAEAESTQKEEAPAAVEVKPAVQTITAASESTESTAKPVETVPAAAGEVIGAVKADEQTSETAKSPDFEVRKLTDEQVTAGYINELLRRISELEDSGDNVNREELLMLNAELDSILEYLRKK